MRYKCIENLLEVPFPLNISAHLFDCLKYRCKENRKTTSTVLPPNLHNFHDYLRITLSFLLSFLSQHRYWCSGIYRRIVGNIYSQIHSFYTLHRWTKQRNSRGHLYTRRDGRISSCQYKRLGRRVPCNLDSGS